MDPSYVSPVQQAWRVKPPLQLTVPTVQRAVHAPFNGGVVRQSNYPKALSGGCRDYMEVVSPLRLDPILKFACRAMGLLDYPPPIIATNMSAGLGVG